MKKHRFESKRAVRRKGLLERLLNALAREREEADGTGPVFDQLEQRVLFSANPLSDMWSPDDQGGYADNAVVAMPLNAGDNNVTATNAAADINAPVISSVSVLNNATLNGPVEFSVTLRDTDSAALDWQLTITNKDTGQTHVMTGDPLGVPGTAYATFALGQIDPAIIGEGKFLLSFRVTDTAGNTAVREVNIEVDVTPPVIESITANKEVLQTLETLQFTINASDNVGVTRYAFSMDGKLIINGKTMAQTFSEAGTHVLTAVAYDKAGNASETFTQTITVVERPDLKAPGINLSPMNNSYQKDGALVRVTITDADSFEVNWTAVLIDNATGQRYSLGSGNRAVSAQTLLTLQKANFADGLYTIEVEAIDKGGNRTFVSNTFTFDTTPPEVSIATGSQRFETGTMRLRLDVEDASPIIGAMLTVNGRTVTLDTNKECLYQFTEPGQYTLVATVRDNALNVTTVTRVITIAENTDFVPPTVTMHSPTAGAYYNSDIVVRATITEDQAAYLGWTVRLTRPGSSNSGVVAKGEGPITDAVVYTLPIYYNTAYGEYVFEIEAVDAAGNVTVERASIFVDPIRPSALRDNYGEFPHDGFGVRHLKDPFRLEWTFTDKGSPEELVTWTIFCENKDTGQTVALKTGNGFGAAIFIDPAQFVSGHYGFTLQIVDAAGNSLTSNEFDTFVDTTPPLFHSVSYENLGYGFKVFATVTDEDMVRELFFTVLSSPQDRYTTDYPRSLGKVTTQGSDYWQIMGNIDFPILEGVYTIKIVARDQSGNESEPIYLTINVHW